jgi:PAS domain S-box-containing protein
MGHPAEQFSQKRPLEEQLNESEERFRILAEAAFEGIAISEGGRVLHVNTHFCSLFGYTAVEACAMQAPQFHPPGEAERVRRMNLTGDEAPYRARCLRKDGSEFVGEIRGRAMPYQGRRVRVTAIRDITSYIEADDQLRRSHEELERRVEERTGQLHALNSALMDKIAELEQFEQVVVGRELKMMELERELSRLRAASGSPPDLP